MRNTLDLRRLKRSRKEKNNTIYEKALRIIEDGYETPELSNEEVLKSASNFPTLKVRVLMGGDISVQSKIDSWIIKDEIRFYTLYHKGMTEDGRGVVKEEYHVQDVFLDLDFLFASIVSHDDYKLGIVKRDNQDLLDMVYEFRVV